MRMTAPKSGGARYRRSQFTINQISRENNDSNLNSNCPNFCRRTLL